MLGRGVFPAAASRMLRGMATPVDVARIEDVTTEHLAGASQFDLDAFGDAQVDEWTALAVIYDEGNWREVVAERCWLQWSIAQQRLTVEEGEGRPLTPGSHPG